MGKDFREIAEIMESRRQAQSPLIEKMIEVRDRYNGEWVVPMVGHDDETDLPPMTPALVADAIDHTALRAGTVQPAIYSPALDASKDTGKYSLDFANRRRKALGYTWHKSNWKTYGARRAFRHLAGYATASLLVVPDFDMECAKIKVRDPLSTYPEPKAAEDASAPANVGYIHGKSADWLAKNYPEAKEILKRGPTQDGALWDVAEWVDGDEIVFVLLGPRSSIGQFMAPRNSFFTELRRWKNHAGMCTAYTPMRVSLDKIASHIANNVGIVDLMARLLALDIRATEKSIYPDRYIIGTPNGTPKIVGGVWREGTSGEVNLLQDVQAIGETRGAPDPGNKQTINQLERNFSASAGLMAPQYGESRGALRTGRGIDALMGASVDPRIQELHEIMEVTLTNINEAVLETYKGYWPDKKYTVFSGWVGDVGMVEFTPSEHFETSENLVTYPIPGADVGMTTVNLGQLLGAEAISKRTFRVRHPWIPDADAEERQVLIETLEKAQQMSLMERATAGGIPPADLSKIKRMIKQGKDIDDAVEMIDRLAQERQAALAPAPEEGQAVAPELMPGLANPGEGAEMQPPPPPIGPPAPGIANFRDLTRAMGQPQTSGAGRPR